MNTDQLIARLVAIADERPNVPIGHVVEHELPELRAQAEAMPSKPSAAQPVAWIQSNHLDNIRRDHRFHCSLADHRFQSDYRPLYTTPPDQTARIAALEAELTVSQFVANDQIEHAMKLRERIGLMEGLLWDAISPCIEGGFVDLHNRICAALEGTK